MIVALTGTGPPFPRMVNALADYARVDSNEGVWVQHGASDLPEPLQGAAFVPHDKLLVRVREASIVVTHGGSGSIGDALAAGHVPVVLPRRSALNEHINDHQLEIVEALEEEARVIAVYDVSALPAAIRAAASRSKNRVGEQGAALKRAVAEEMQRLGLARPQTRRRQLVWQVLRAVTTPMRSRRLDPRNSSGEGEA